MRNAYLVVAAIMTTSLFFFVSPSMAESIPCQMSDGYLDRGIGGTGRTLPGEDDGIGGTGVSAPGQMANAFSTVQNIYVIGTVYARGSICVNGVRIAYPEDLLMEDDEKKTYVRDLELGQLVEVEAKLIEGSSTIQARKVSLVSPLQGPVTAVYSSSGEIEVMGERIRIGDASGQANLKTGDLVRLSGLRNLSDHLVATSVQVISSAEEAHVEGHFRISSEGMTAIGKTPVVLPAGIKAPVDGADVEAKGVWRDGALHLSEVETEEEETFSPGYISIEGYVETGNETSRAVICDEEFDMTNLKDVSYSEGERVIITATIDDKGKMTAVGLQKIELPQLHVTHQVQKK